MMPRVMEPSGNAKLGNMTASIGTKVDVRRNTLWIAGQSGQPEVPTRAAVIGYSLHTKKIAKYMTPFRLGASTANDLRDDDIGDSVYVTNSSTPTIELFVGFSRNGKYVKDVLSIFRSLSKVPSWGSNWYSGP